MAEIAQRSPSRPLIRRSAWREFKRQDDWWAIWIGLSLVLIAVALFANHGVDLARWPASVRRALAL